MRTNPPDPTGLLTLDAVTGYLRRLRAWAGQLSYPELTRRLNRLRGNAGKVGQTTVYDCFRPGRKRLDVDLVLSIADILGLDDVRKSLLKRGIEVAAGQTHAASAVDARASIPAPSEWFTGRTAELHAVAHLLSAGGGVLSITGPAGIGKTEFALAVAAAFLHPANRGYGRLFIDLHGFDGDQPPSPAEAALAGLLTRLGVHDDLIRTRPTLQRRAELYRSVLRGRRLVLVLDDAADSEQARWLLPHSPACVVLITSRARLTAGIGGAELRLGPLEPQDAVELLRRRDCADRIAADPVTARRIAERQCFLRPLDLTALAGQLADPREAAWTLADHEARLASFPPDEVVRPALAGSYNSLPEQSRRLFRLLAVHPAHEFSTYDAAALADLPLTTAAEDLARLAGRCLLDEAPQGRYRFHEAVHAFARRLLIRHDPASAQRAARARLRSMHAYTVARALARCAPHEASRVPAVEPPDTPVPVFADRAQALRWLEEERHTLIAVALDGAATNRKHTWSIAVALSRRPRSARR